MLSCGVPHPSWIYTFLNFLCFIHDYSGDHIPRIEYTAEETKLWWVDLEHAWSGPFLVCVAVPGRNRTLFRCVFRSHYRIWSAVTQLFRYGWSLYVLCKLMNTWHIYTVHMNPTPNSRYTLQHFECGNAMEICNGIMFDFHLGLPHVFKTSVSHVSQGWDLSCPN